MNAGNEIGWVPVALSRDIGNGTAAPVLVRGREVVLWRGASGALHAWEDRCPHRGMRLSFGFVRGEQLACLYHGWHYGPDGGCELIPAHPGLVPPKTICATAFPSREAHGLVWMFSERDAPEESDVPPVPADAVPVRSLTVDLPLATVVRDLVETAAASVEGHLATLAVPTSDGASEICFAALQPVDAGRTTLHVLVKASGGVASPVVLTGITRWCERLRRRLESTDRAAEAA